MPSLAKPLLLPSLGALLGISALLLSSDTALAHGTCSGWSSVSASGTTANYRSTSECSEEVVEIKALATLWSFVPGSSITVRYEDWDLDIKFFDTRASAPDDHGMESGRCYVTVGGHKALDTHWRWWPPAFIPHLWMAVTFSPGAWCQQ